jgi:hydroxypyruvate isomerase
MPRYAANLTMMFNEWTFLDRFAAAADAGFEAVEFLFPYDHPPEEIARRLQARGLTQALFNLRPGDWAAGERGLAALPERAGEFRQSVATALVYAQATGVGRVHVMSGIADAADPRARAAYVDAIAYAADQAGAANVDICLEPINKRDMPGYFLNDFDLALDLMTEIGRPNVKLQFDIYHRQILHGDVLTALEATMPRIGHVQIAAVPKRNEPTTGELDDARVLRALDELGYAGYVGLEYRPKAATLDGLSWRTRI